MYLRTMMIAAVAAGLAGTAAAQEEKTVNIPINEISAKGVGTQIGSVTASETGRGELQLRFDIRKLPAGPHGVHIHENGDCKPAKKDGKMTAGAAAGGHFDPDKTGKHLGPSGDGHKGDLPVLVVKTDGKAKDGSVEHTMVAPRLKLADIRGKALMIHAGGDNFKDEPKPLGGGGARIACGVIP